MVSTENSGGIRSLYWQTLSKLLSVERWANAPLKAYRVAGSLGTSAVCGLSKMASGLGSLRKMRTKPTNSAAAPSPTAPLKHSNSASDGTVPSTSDTPSTHALGVAFWSRCGSKSCNKLGRKRMNEITSGLTPLLMAHVVQSSRWVSNSITVSRLRRWLSTRLAPARSAWRLPVDTTIQPSGMGTPCRVRAWQMLASTFCRSGPAWLRSSNSRMPCSGALPFTGNQSGSL